MTSVVQLSKATRLVGQKVYSRGTSKAVHAFLGIPYAKPPVGNLRFQAPQPTNLWEGSKDATQFGPICPQDMVMSGRTHYPFPMPTSVSEDCLYLNIWTPTTDPSGDPLAVMFWIYGGSFIQGFSNFYDGTVFASRQNVVFVSINYRVGPFGFLSTGDDTVPGNAGLLDQVEALKWVKKHISKFGGDPENVTIFGESAGAISTSFHLCSPLSRGLYRRAICQSGTALHPGSVWPRQNARKYLLKKLQAMGCETTDSQKILTFLSGFSGQELVGKLGSGFAPVYDNHFMPGSLDDHYNSPTRNPPVDLLIGFNSHEGAQFVFQLARSKTMESLQQARHLVDVVVRKMFFRGSPAAAEVAREVTAEYLKDTEVMTPEQLMEALCHVYGDVLFVAPSVKTADVHSSTSPTFMYRFNHRSAVSSHPGWVTADHGQEITLVIGEPWLQRFPDVWSDVDKTVSTRLMTYWANFAKNGNPNSNGLPYWPQYTNAERRYMELDEGAHEAADFQPVRMGLWNTKVESLAAQKATSKY